MTLYAQFPLAGVVNKIFLIRGMGIMTGYAVKHGAIAGIHHALAIGVGRSVLTGMAELAYFKHIRF